MEIDLELVFFGILICVVVYSFFTKVIERSIVTLPIVFVAVGYLASEPLGMLGDMQTQRSYARYIAEVTLILVLFADASHVRFANLKASFRIPLRMLVFGMPLAILFGALMVVIVSPESGLAMAFLTAAVLAPTDAALGQAVVTNPKVPDYLSQSINVESGLNDGLALPFILLAAVLASTAMQTPNANEIASEAVLQIILGPLAGLIIGWMIARTLDFCQSKNWMLESAEGVVFFTTAFACYLGAELIGGNGFIAAFVGGMVFGNTYKKDLRFITEFMEGTGQLFTMAAFIIFGAIMLPEGLAHISWTAMLVAILFLTVVRMGAIWVSLIGSGLKQKEKLFLGWFGPRGLASVLFTLVIMAEFDFPNEEEFLACISMTVFLSVILHGISSNPLANRIGKN